MMDSNHFPLECLSKHIKISHFSPPSESKTYTGMKAIISNSCVITSFPEFPFNESTFTDCDSVQSFVPSNGDQLVVFASESSVVAYYGSSYHWRKNSEQTYIPHVLHGGLSYNFPPTWDSTIEAEFVSVISSDSQESETNDVQWRKAHVDWDQNTTGLYFVLRDHSGKYIKRHDQGDFLIQKPSVVASKEDLLVSTPYIEIPVKFNLPRDTESISAVHHFRDKSVFWMVPKAGVWDKADDSSTKNKNSVDFVPETQLSIFKITTRTESRFILFAPLIETTSGARISIRNLLMLDSEQLDSEQLFIPFVLRMDFGLAVIDPVKVSTLLNVKNLFYCTQLTTKADSPVKESTQIYQLIQDYGISIQTLLSTPRRTDKPPPGNAFFKLGWCSWDAYGHAVTSSKIKESLQSLVDHKVNVKWLLIDDGWQSGGRGSTPEQILSSDSKDLLFDFKPNLEFWTQDSDRDFDSSDLDNEFRDFTTSIRSDFQIENVFVWMTIHGYWGGVASSLASKLGHESRRIKAVCCSGVRENDPVESKNYWESFCHVLKQDSMEDFYNQYFKYLKSVNVSGVKVDVQAFLETLSHGWDVPRVHFTRGYKNALAINVARYFQANQEESPLLINCMSCSTDAIYLSTQKDLIWRSSNDHAFENVPETAWSVSHHIWTNALNSLWMSEFFWPDWDMFRSGEWHAGIHAASRVVAGSPIYVSDRRIDDEASKLLNSLTNSAGVIIKPRFPGRPFPGVLFRNPLEEDMIFTIWTMNSCNALFALFNLRNRGFGSPVIKDSLYFEEVDTIGDYFDEKKFQGFKSQNEYILWSSGPPKSQNSFLQNDPHHFVTMTPTESKKSVCLYDMNFDMLVVSPLLKTELERGAGVLFAPLGIRGKMNAGNAVKSIQFDKKAAMISIQICDSGELFCRLELCTSAKVTNVWVKTENLSRIETEWKLINGLISIQIPVTTLCGEIQIILM